MDINKLYIASFLVTAISIPTITNAEIVSIDWKTSGDNLITLDTSSGLEWLDLTATSNRSYNTINSSFGENQEFEGWRYATYSEVGTFWDAFGGDSNHYDGWSTQNNGLFDLIAPYWGDLYCEATGCNTGEGYSNAKLQYGTLYGHYYAQILDLTDDPTLQDQDYAHLLSSTSKDTAFNSTTGHALVRVSAVPIPAAIWLFGSGLIGLILTAKRKT
ncbi:MAG: hypothetical protein DIZ80_09280 [endosymbiont of Galathealinum brachiosum]|uniref:DUF1566 domain-containing protein n=1 Tax=endosymbiont of Galathealinum brachiosum TaxID=2200906 RepID=A0A370DC68_9GAMM|nr:MAG: hypothetical protein DIZ80_09280 [endosymbiont of Galathealinum brachiosum]